MRPCCTTTQAPHPGAAGVDARAVLGKQLRVDGRGRIKRYATLAEQQKALVGRVCQRCGQQLPCGHN